MTASNTQMTTDNATYRLHPHARFRLLDDEGIFVLQEAGEVVVVNQVGAMIVKNLNEGHSISTVVEQVVEEFDVDSAHARNDINTLVSDLTSAGALILA